MYYLFIVLLNLLRTRAGEEPGSVWSILMLGWVEVWAHGSKSGIGPKRNLGS